ncbi:MAG: gamma-glutamyltransferase, partial [Gammaproteobacteria bacterium]|nr:gamma-glutamyltransferase [Gammaproteobacteria bacterium]
MTRRPLARRFATLAFAAIAALPGIALSGAAVAQSPAAQAPINTYNAIHHPVVGRNGMVASQNFLATEIGVDILR